MSNEEIIADVGRRLPGFVPLLEFPFDPGIRVATFAGDAKQGWISVYLTTPKLCFSGGLLTEQGPVYSDLLYSLEEVLAWRARTLLTQ